MLEGILHLCKKHGSYTCRATLRNFVGNIPTLFNFLRKIPTHGINVGIIPTSVGMIPRSVGIVPTRVRIIPTLVEICRNYSCTAKRCLTFCAMCRNFSYKLQQCGNISYKILQKILYKVLHM